MPAKKKSPTKRKSTPKKKVAKPIPAALIPEKIAPLVTVLRHEKVLLDSDLAELYGVATKVLNQAVKRNIDRFPSDFMFQVTEDEMNSLRSQSVTLNEMAPNLRSQSAIARSAEPNLRSQIVTSRSAEPAKESKAGTSTRHGGRRTLPHAFTEQGVAMLSSVLRSPRAVEVNIAIMRTFVQLRRLMDSNALLAEKIESLEKKYAEHDQHFQLVFDAIKQLIAAPKPNTREMGFHTRDK